MSKHKVETKPTLVAPEGARISGPGTRSKNPRAYDKYARDHGLTLPASAQKSVQKS